MTDRCLITPLVEATTYTLPVVMSGNCCTTQSNANRSWADFVLSIHLLCLIYRMAICGSSLELSQKLLQLAEVNTSPWEYFCLWLSLGQWLRHALQYWSVELRVPILDSWQHWRSRSCRIQTSWCWHKLIQLHGHQYSLWSSLLQLANTLNPTSCKVLCVYFLPSSP